MRYFGRARNLWWLIPAALLLLLAASPAVAKEPSIVRRPTAASATTDPLADRVVAYGWQLIKAFPDSSYNHKTHIDVAQRVCEVDCSGFVANVFAEISPRHVAAVQALKKRSRPLAEDFYNTFAATRKGSVPGWRCVPVAEARPGDVIAWWKEEHEKGENTGHVMILAESPVLEAPGKYRLRVLDSTARPHAFDTRPAGKSGLGAGTIWLEVDRAGEILGYHWKSAGGKLDARPVAIGRAVAF
jgi:hypothetical protein